MSNNLNDICNYFKNVIIPHTPDDFVVADSFRYSLTDTEINAGINDFRSFLYAMYDKIAADNFPVISELSALLYFMGVQGKLETDSVYKLIVRGSDLLIKTKKNSVPHQAMKKMSSKRTAELFMFLSEMGFCFENINYSKPIKLSETETFIVSNENNSNVITGLKLLAKAQEHIATDRDRLQNNFTRCNFFPLENETSKHYDVKLLDCVDTQPSDIKEWLVELEKLLTENGCVAGGEILDYASFTYTSPKTKQMICKIDMLLSGCKITPNTLKIKCLDEIAPTLSDEFLQALKEDGCTCGRNCKKGPYKISYNGEDYLSCHNPPHKIAGFNIPLNNAENLRIIRKWIESELGV
jgi:hypothetical protein